MTTWEEIRDEVAEMLADGKPLEDVISKLEKIKNEMAKAELIKTIDEMKKHKPMTNEEWRKTCSTEEFAKWVFDIIGFCLNYETYPDKNKYRDLMGTAEDIERWLNQPHGTEAEK